MNCRYRKEALLVITALLVSTFAIAWTDADIRTSSLFFINSKWPIGEQFPWKLLYRIDRTPAVAMAAFGLAMFAISMYRPAKTAWRKPGLFLLLVLVIGPGLIVNATFKDHWGRPRPREITQFEGKKEFLHPWQKGISGNGRSFPSGHSSAAFYMIAPYFIYRRTKRAKAYCWLAGGILFGTLMSIARIAQGGHFLSDCLWALGFVYLTALLLAALLKLESLTPAAASGHD